MSAVFLALAGLNLALIGLLPRIFFDARGRKNAAWWATAVPFFAAGVVLVLCFTGIWQPWYSSVPGALAEHPVDVEQIKPGVFSDIDTIYCKFFAHDHA